MIPINTDIAVLGGGPAGLAAAIHARRTAKCRITVLERNPRIGKKLINTGNGRCNISHFPVDFNAFHGERNLAEQVFSKSAAPEDFFWSLGLKLRADRCGNVYPYSNTAASVLDALRIEISNLKINVLTDCHVIKIEPLPEGFRLIPENPELPIINARRLILAPGGMAAPATGSDGTVFDFIKKLKINILNPLASLCPIKTEPKLTRAVKGLRLNASCSAILSGRTLRTETGEVQFGEDKLSGICIFNLSRLAAIHGKELMISLDLTPEINLDDLLKFIIHSAKIRAKSPIEDLLTGLLPKRCAVTLTKLITDKPMDFKVTDLNSGELNALALIIKDWRFPVISCDRWSSAQTTAGGVPSSELSENLSSKRNPHLYFAGEVINVDGDCGGYNLMWCWRSGELAGTSAAKSI
ncbi:MAG: aminoacetone oxidase family FAD-binding enzyme [Eubacterium sp.]|nr:aminoacetone oxidase family FAD-binding enzyme [Eubacterium sp.]